ISALKRTSPLLSAFQPTRIQPMAFGGMVYSFPSLSSGVQTSEGSSDLVTSCSTGSASHDSGATQISTRAHLQFCQLIPTGTSLFVLFLYRKAWCPAVNASSDRPPWASANTSRGTSRSVCLSLPSGSGGLVLDIDVTTKPRPPANAMTPIPTIIICFAFMTGTLGRLGCNLFWASSFPPGPQCLPILIGR